MELLLDTRGRRMVKCLALVLLCVTTARVSASCLRPGQTQNSILADEALLMNEFPEGVDVEFQCANGYTLEEGSRTITCIGGAWTELTMKCKKIDCGLPKEQPHMSYKYSNNGTLFGASVAVLCDRGYMLSGVSYKQCFVVGWIGKAKCEPIFCANPDEVKNGTNTWDPQNPQVEYGKTIEYFCNEGYTLIGTSSIQCSENGRYYPLPPECKRANVTKNPVTEASTPAGTSAALTSHRAVSTAGVTSASLAFPTSGGTEGATSPSPTSGGTEGATSPSPTSGGTEGATSPSPSLGGDRDTYPPEEDVTTTRVSSNNSSFAQGERGNINTYTTVVIVLTVLSAAALLYFVLYKLKRRKGSYDTREDLKPELLQFQGL